MSNTIIFPTLQIGPINITHDSWSTSEILKNIGENTQAYITSPYFHLTDEYEDIILNHTKGNIDIIVASPRANGFIDSRGISKYIPPAYSIRSILLQNPITNQNI